MISCPVYPYRDGFVSSIPLASCKPCDGTHLPSPNPHRSGMLCTSGPSGPTDVWEHDETFKEHLRQLRCMAVDMETATIFVAGFHNEIPSGALLLVSDQPMIPDGVKTEESDQVVTENYAHRHLQIGIDSLNELKNAGITVKHLQF